MRKITLDASDDRVLDRLVDGELSDREERAVIAQLEQLPDGWRRCGLAFLEARCWQREANLISQRISDVAGGKPGKDSGLLHPPKRRHHMRWIGPLALCAVFLLAFGVGQYMPQRWQSRSTQQVAQPQASVPNAPVQLVDNTAAKTSPVDGTITPLTEQPSDLLVGNLTFVDNSGKEIDVPVYDWNEQVAEQLMYRSQPLSPDIVRHLKRHQVRSYQSFVPVRLKDGRQVLLPVQELDITPVVNTAY